MDSHGHQLNSCWIIIDGSLTYPYDLKIKEPTRYKETLKLGVGLGGLGLSFRIFDHLSERKCEEGAKQKDTTSFSTSTKIR